MNYARLKDWIEECVEDLVQFGVPRVDADAVMSLVELGAVAAEAKARADRQFLLDFDRLGSVALGERLDMSPQGVCKKRTKILSGLNHELNAQLNAA